MDISHCSTAVSPLLICKTNVCCHDDVTETIYAKLAIWDGNPSINSNAFQYFMMTSSNGDIFRVTGHLCGNSTVPAEFPAQRPVTRSFDAFFDLRLNKRLSEQWWGWWFETSSRHYDVIVMFFVVSWNNILLYYKQMDIGVMHTPIFLRVISTILHSYI